VEELYLDDAEYIVTAYGIASRVARQVVEDMRKAGYKLGMIRPITLFPFPAASFDKLDYSRVKGVIDIEMTIPGQMKEDVAAAVARRAPVYEYGRSGGVLLDDCETRNAVEAIVRGEKEAKA
ncbi:MAG: 3-methyl-2-oxobutanoate dehydrogenase subunit beta, partial [Oscillospiraceae bacterium]|nr:3-methyl-2-oxobutanoate dehydrogenase subunit beta [Oscillospiraceae bacterium]